MPEMSSAPYVVGDYYYDGTKEGLVFDVWDGGNSGKIVSIKEGCATWSDDFSVTTNAIDADDGKINMSIIKTISDWETKYPAFKWCADLGDDWYLPAINELNTIYSQKDAINNMLELHCINLLCSLDIMLWSSSESLSHSAKLLNFISGSYAVSSKTSIDAVRAVAIFGDAQQSDPTPKPEITSAPYAVGDYYNDGTKEGVVFEVSADGTSGKIVSMMKSTGRLQWSSDETEQKRLIGADSQADGAANMAVVKAISGWETKYPAFKWCADLGDGWYLPSIEELFIIYDNKDKFNTNLTDKLSGSYWSSTEYDNQSSSGYFGASYVSMDYGSAGDNFKSNDHYVRAVSAF